ncbi:MAG: helix-turn-helix transcriptional regulator [Clostridia bacterium]|nr:helix-turn-helix transcriptional regulator [Clostridia bacterium]
MVNLDNLFLRIKELGLTAKKISDDTGISTGNISDWKSGRSMPTAIKLDILATYLNCSVDYLLGRTDCPDLIVTGKDGKPVMIQMMTPPEQTHKIKIAASDGSISSATVTDSDIKKIDALPDADDI